MPFAGGIAPPVITPLRGKRLGSKAHSTIDSGTYIELETESPNSIIFFTTDGSKPNPFQRKVGGREVTFKYRAPFTMKPGRRCIKAVAVHRVTRMESHVMNKIFHVEDVLQSTSNDSQRDEADEDADYDRNDVESQLDLDEMSEKGVDSCKSKSRHSAWQDDADDSSSMVDHFLQRTADQGFSATNVSGTQINLWGGNPGLGWDIKTPDKMNLSGSYQPPYQQQPQPQSSFNAAEAALLQQQQQQQHMAMMASQLNQRMEQNRQSTLAEIRQTLKEMDSTRAKQLAAAVPPPPPPQPKMIASHDPPPVNAVSPGDGNLRKQLEHVYGHLLNFARENAEFKAAISTPKMGKVVSAEFDESDDSYLVTIQLGKPGVKKVAPPPVKKPAPAKKKPSIAGDGAVPLALKDVVVPEGHKAEIKVEQRRGEKAAAIELKTEEKPPEEVEHSYFETEEYVQEGTLKPADPFNAEEDCQALHKAMKGLGTDEQAIIDIMSKRSFRQRSEIVTKFKSLFGKDLSKELGSELSYNFKKVCQALCLSPDDYDASELRRAMKGAGTDEDALIEVICTRTNKQVEAFKEAYKRLYPNRNLENDIDSETSSDFKSLLISLLQATRDESPTFDPEKVKADALELFHAGEGKFGTEESKFHQIILNRSNAHLRAMFLEYERMSTKTMEQIIKDEMSGDLRDGYLTFVRCIQNKPAYFAKALQKSMKGLGTDDDTLLRIVICRCEVDMVQIRDAFKAEFGGTLGEWIKDDTSGDYRKMLLNLVGEADLIKK